MSLQALTYVVVGLSFALYIVIAIWSRAETTGDFYVAGTGVSPVVNGMATAADWMSAASFLSMAGLIAFLGYDGSVYLMGWTGGYVLLALLLAPYLRKFGKFTVPQFIGERYYSNAARLVAVVCLIVISFTYVAGQMRGVGMLAGLLFTYGYIEFFKGLFLKWAGAPWGADVADNWLFGISPEGIGVLGMCLNIVIAVAVSAVTAPPPRRVQALVEQIRVPRDIDEKHL